MDEDKRLPYDFDLHYNIKTEEELAREMLWARSRYYGLLELCRHHKLDGWRYIMKALQEKEAKHADQDK